MFGLENAQSLVGVFVTMGICWALSEKRSAFPWKLAIGAIAVQAGLGLLLFGAPAARPGLGGGGGGGAGAAAVRRPGRTLGAGGGRDGGRRPLRQHPGGGEVRVRLPRRRR